MPTFSARFVHTNLIALDWRRLADFYTRVFGCVLAPPVRHYDGPDLAAATGIPSAVLDGAHLRLPGFDEDGPTLEIFQYIPQENAPLSTPNRVGFGHIAFGVDSVGRAREAVIAAGGSAVGEVVTSLVPGKGKIEWAYVRDPEGNMIELQTWS